MAERGRDVDGVHSFVDNPALPPYRDQEANPGYPLPKNTNMSGISYQYRVEALDGAPISYEIGYAWGGVVDEIRIGMIRGIRALSPAYEGVPGMGGAKQRGESLRGQKDVLMHAAELLYTSGGGKTRVTWEPPARTLGSYITGHDLFHGKEMAAHAGLDLDTPFRDCWIAFADAMVDYPKSKWGSAYRCAPTEFKVTRVSDGSEVFGADKQAVLDAAIAWSNAFTSQDLNAALKLLP